MLLEWPLEVMGKKCIHSDTKIDLALPSASGFDAQKSLLRYNKHIILFELYWQLLCMSCKESNKPQIYN